MAPDSAAILGEDISLGRRIAWTCCRYDAFANQQDSSQRDQREEEIEALEGESKDGDGEKQVASREGATI